MSFADLERQIRDRAFELVSAASEVVLQETRAAAPVDTGRLRDSIELGPVVMAGDKVSVTIGSPLDYALFTDVGTRPHEITGNPLLAFEWPAAGPGVFFFHSVQHPGTTGTDWFGTNDLSVMGNRWSDALGSVA